MTKKETLADVVARIKEDLEKAEKMAYADHSNVRPIISQARKDFNRVGFVQEVDRL